MWREAGAGSGGASEDGMQDSEGQYSGRSPPPSDDGSRETWGRRDEDDDVVLGVVALREREAGEERDGEPHGLGRVTRHWQAGGMEAVDRVGSMEMDKSSGSIVTQGT